MTERPIIFSAPMVRAILQGRKSQTRRRGKRDFLRSGIVEWAGREMTPVPSYAPGDRLWVRETWAHDAPNLNTCRLAVEDACPGGYGFGPYYRATEVAPDTLHWRSPIHMPRWASRLTLTVTDVRVQRLGEISEEDAQAEGAGIEFRMVLARPDGGPDYRIPPSYRGGFANLWSRIHGHGAWEANPWVAAITFTARKGNIDATEGHACAAQAEWEGRR